jgi:hypothetical protein
MPLKIFNVSLTLDLSRKRPAGPNDERLHSGHAILSRCGRQGEPANRCSFHDKVHLSQRRGRTLPFQNLEIVAVMASSVVAVSCDSACGAFCARTRGELHESDAMHAMAITP